MTDAEYSPQLGDQLIEYFNLPSFTEKSVTKYTAKGEIYTQIVKMPVSLPTLAGFASSIGIRQQLLNEWAKRHEEFAHCIKIAKMHQESILLDNALAGRYVPSIALFLLKHLCHWGDGFPSEWDDPDEAKNACTSEVILQAVVNFRDIKDRVNKIATDCGQLSE